MSLKSVIISGGGTGGHIFPALAIANEIKYRYPDCHIHFVGAQGRMEMEKIPSNGFEITGLPIQGFQRRQIWKNWKLPFKLLKSLLLSGKIIKKHKPQLVIGVGGYASAAIGKTAQWMKIATLLQEQNGYPGVTNKLLAKKAKVICVAYPKMESFFPAHALHITGNPVRKEIINLPPKKEETYQKFGLETGKLTILIIGGSLGARSINNAAEKWIDKLLENNFQVIWQTGRSFQLKKHQQDGLYQSFFISDMAAVYSIADIIISRAGAISISELCIVGKPTILIPSPNVAEDHQTKNAMALVEGGAAILVKDSEINKELFNSIKDIADNKAKALKLAKNIKSMAKPEAVKDIVDLCESITNGN